MRFDLTALTPVTHPITLHPGCSWAWDQGSGHWNWADLQGLMGCAPRRVWTLAAVTVKGGIPFLSQGPVPWPLCHILWPCKNNCILLIETCVEQSPRVYVHPSLRFPQRLILWSFLSAEHPAVIAVLPALLLLGPRLYLWHGILRRAWSSCRCFHSSCVTHILWWPPCSFVWGNALHQTEYVGLQNKNNYLDQNLTLVHQHFPLFSLNLSVSSWALKQGLANLDPLMGLVGLIGPRWLECPQFSPGNPSEVWSQQRVQENLLNAGEENDEGGIRTPHLIEVVWVQELKSFPGVLQETRWHHRYICVSWWGPEKVVAAQDRHQTRSLGHLHCELYQINRDFLWKMCQTWVNKSTGKGADMGYALQLFGLFSGFCNIFQAGILLNVFIESPWRTFQGSNAYPNVWTGISLNVLCRKCRQSTGTLKVKTNRY